jgi:hypothetical protein
MEENLIALTRPNYRFPELKPNEDSFLIKGNAFAVADGITRDPEVDDPNLPWEKELLKYYPRPSGAKTVADIFCDVFTASIPKNTPSVDSINKAFIEANDKIKGYNSEKIKEVDYLKNDYFACVAAGGFISEGKLYWGQLCDCGIAVFDENLNLKFQTNDDFEDTNRLFEEWSKKTGKTMDWRKAEDRQFWRREFRNTHKYQVNGKALAFGALTGEPEMADFLNIGQLDLAQGDLIVFYTDGYKEAIILQRFLRPLSDAFKNGIEKLEELDLELAEKEYTKYGHERTLVALRV